MDKTDEELVKEAQGGTLSSFEVIVKRYQNRIFYHTLRLLNDKEKAEDATQETFVRVFKRLESFDKDRRFKPWLYKIATNLCIDVLRKRVRDLPLRDFENVEESRDNIGEMVKKERFKILRSALLSLPKIYKNLLEGYYMQEQSYQSLAKLHALPLNTVKTRMRRGREFLKRRLYGKI